MEKRFVYKDPNGVIIAHRICEYVKVVEINIPGIKLYNKDFLIEKGIPPSYIGLISGDINLFKEEELPKDLFNFLNMAKNITSELGDSGKTKHYLTVIFSIPRCFIKPINLNTIIKFAQNVYLQEKISEVRFVNNVDKQYGECINKQQMSKLLHGLVLNNDLYETLINKLRDFTFSFIRDHYLYLPYSKYWLILRLYLFYENKNKNTTKGF